MGEQVLAVEFDALERGFVVGADIEAIFRGVLRDCFSGVGDVQTRRFGGLFLGEVRELYLGERPVELVPGAVGEG